jgi:hypothetical protein
MGVGGNYILNKGFLATGTTGYIFGKAVVASGAGTSCAIAGAGAQVLGVLQETVDDAKITTGKAVVDVALDGLCRVMVGAAVAVGDMLTTDSSARAITKAKAGAGVQPGNIFARALTAATAANQMIDVQLLPGGQF